MNTKWILTLAILLAVCFGSRAATADSELKRALDEARTAIEQAQNEGVDFQSLVDLDEARQTQVVNALKLTKQQQKQFETLYRSYRKEMAHAVKAMNEAKNASDAAQKQMLKAKLTNIEAAAAVKRNYVDKFGSILSADQIRTLYNTEGEIGADIKEHYQELDGNLRQRNASDWNLGQLNALSSLDNEEFSTATKSRYIASGAMSKRDFGAADNYTSLSVAQGIEVEINPTVSTITIEANDHVLDLIAITKSNGGLKFGYKSQSRTIANAKVKAVIPASTALKSIMVSSYGKVKATSRLDLPLAEIKVSSMGILEADIHTGKIEISASSYGKFTGNVDATAIKVNASSCGSVLCNLTADNLEISTSSFSHYKGTIAATQTLLSASSSAEIESVFKSRTFRASTSSYAKIFLNGSASVDEGSATATSGGRFSANDLRVNRYTASATSQGSIELYCTENLMAESSSGGRITYSGNCSVAGNNVGLRKR